MIRCSVFFFFSGRWCIKLSFNLLPTAFFQHYLHITCIKYKWVQTNMIVCGHCMSAHKRPLKFFTCKLKLFRTYHVAAFFFFFFFFGYVWERNSFTLIYSPMFISWVTARGRRNKVSFILQQQQFITQIAPKFQVIKSNSQKIHLLDEGCSCWQGQGSSCRQTWASHSLESHKSSNLHPSNSVGIFSLAPLFGPLQTEPRLFIKETGKQASS